MNFNSLPKFVINLETRPENLENVRKELDYIGWDWERFNAINRGDYMGCTFSHLEVKELWSSKMTVPSCLTQNLFWIN
jgi:hypothetical protein